MAASRRKAGHKRKPPPPEASKATQWKPGQSGNPSGTPAAPKDKAEYIGEVRKCSWGALCALWDIVNNPDADDGDRRAAAADLLTRGWGNGAVVITGEDGGPLKIDAGDALIAMVRKLAGDIDGDHPKGDDE